MLARNEVILKWALYAAVTALCFLVQGLLQHMTIWGVIPFLYPMLAAIAATFEAPAPSTVFALCIGIACDTLLPGPIPCFYTLVFPVVGLLCALLAQSILPSGFLCSCTGSVLAFFLTDLFHCLILWVSGQSAWRSGAFLMLRELCVTLPLLFPVTVLYRAVHRKVHMYD